MGFSIQLDAPRRQRPEQDNRDLVAELTQRFSSLADFPLDHDLIAREYAKVPRDEVLNHWAQFELHGDESVGNPIITLWLEAAFVELPSAPSESCKERLRRVGPILEFFEERGFCVQPMAELVAEYEEQRKRVETVARIVDEHRNG